MAVDASNNTFLECSQPHLIFHRRPVITSGLADEPHLRTSPTPLNRVDLKTRLAMTARGDSRIVWKSKAIKDRPKRQNSDKKYCHVKVAQLRRCGRVTMRVCNEA